MSTCNFKDMADFYLICGGEPNEYRELLEKDYDADEITDDWIYDEIRVDAEIFADKAEKFSNTLNYYNVTVSDGYYVGWQFLVEPKEVWENAFNKDSIYCIDNEDAQYYFGKCRSRVLREAEAECRKINKWLDKQARKPLMHKLNCVGVFSNGEAVYEDALIKKGVENAH